VVNHPYGIRYETISQDVNNTGPETLPVSVCKCFLYFTCKENILKMFV